VAVMSGTKKKAEALRNQFKTLDSSGDGRLDLREMSALLKKGNPKMTDPDCRAVFTAADTDHDGKISFQEFVTFVYAADGPEPHEELVAVFATLTGSEDGEMDKRQFAKMCQDTCLHNAKFKSNEADLVFGKVTTRNEKTLGVRSFAKALEVIAEKRGCAVVEVYKALGITAEA
ncbi:unnamed protein product, partial [Polarella glacialis]